MFTRKLGRIKFNNFIYIIIITIIYALVAMIIAFSNHYLILTTQALLKNTFGLIFDFETVLKTFTLVTTFGWTLLVLHLIDRKLYQLRMLMKLENVAMLRKYLLILAVVTMFSTLFGFYVAKSFYYSGNIIGSIIDISSNFFQEFIRDINNTIVLERRTKTMDVYNWIIYILYLVATYLIILAPKRVFNFNFEDGIYINKQLVEFNVYCVHLCENIKEHKKHYLFDFFSTYHLYKDKYKRFEQTNSEYLDMYSSSSDNTIYIYTSKTRLDNYYVVASRKATKKRLDYYCLTDINIQSLIHSMPTPETEQNFSIDDVDNHEEVVENQNESNSIPIEPVEFDPKFLQISSGKTNVLKAIFSSILTLIIFALLITIFSTTINYIYLLIGFDPHHILASFIRYSLLLILLLKTTDIYLPIGRLFKLESFRLNNKLFVICAIIAFILYNLGIPLAQKLYATGNILTAMQYILNNPLNLLIDELTVRMILFDDVRIPMIFTIVAKIIVFFNLYMHQDCLRFEFERGIYINKEHINFQKLSVKLPGVITPIGKYADDYDDTPNNILIYFDQFKDYLMRCNEDTVYTDTYNHYTIYYGYCNNSQKCVVAIGQCGIDKIKYGHIKRSTNYSTDTFQKYFICDSSFIQKLESISYDERIQSQWQFK